jgi:FtsZ-binding cell division protein ZapB
MRTKVIESTPVINSLKKEIYELREKNHTLNRAVDIMQKELKSMYHLMNIENKKRYLNDFESKPIQFLDVPTDELFHNRFVATMYFRKTEKYIKYSKTLREFFSQSDKELAAKRGWGKKMVAHIRLLESMINKNSIDRSQLL